MRLTTGGKRGIRNAGLLPGGADNVCIDPLRCKTVHERFPMVRKAIEVITDEKGRYGTPRLPLPQMDTLQPGGSLGCPG